MVTRDRRASSAGNARVVPTWVPTLEIASVANSVSLGDDPSDPLPTQPDHATEQPVARPCIVGFD